MILFDICKPKCKEIEITMDDKDIEYLRKKLIWYLYECQYMDYNPQEVNFILKVLEECNPENEKKIETSYVVFTHRAISEKETVKRTLPGKRITAISVAALAIASSLFFAISLHNESIAGLKNGLFNYIRRDDSGVEFFIVPEKKKEDNIFRVKSIDEVPKSLQNIIWIPANEESNFDLSYIDFTEEEIISVKFVDKENNYIEFLYSSAKEYEDPLNLYEYNGMKIYSYVTTNDESKLYCYAFSIREHKYYVESNIEDILDHVYEFIDFVLAR